MEVLSNVMFQTLDFIGYNQDIIELRRNYWKQNANIFDSLYLPARLHLKTTGSKGEGITAYFESDVDNMYCFKDALCTGNVANAASLYDMTTVYADTSETPPGYTRLLLISYNGYVSRSIVQESTFESESQNVYLSSCLFATSLKNQIRQLERGQMVRDISGPAVHACSADMLPADAVVAFYCYYPQLLQSWKSRPRVNEWPPVNVREEAASLLAQVVPVGSKGSCDQWREWRFCFIDSELKLTFSLNETQLKLYIILKMVAKEILCHASNEISSYIMKNITYWVSELFPETVFKRENLVKLLILSLRFLKLAISEWNCLPYYMIPGRNLLAERLTPVCRRHLIVLIDTLLEEGPQFILRCTKLRSALTVRLAAPALLLKYRETRDRVEMLLYCKKILVLQNADISDIIRLNEEIKEIIMPEWRMLLFRGFSSKEITDRVNLCGKVLLS